MLHLQPKNTNKQSKLIPRLLSLTPKTTAIIPTGPHPTTTLENTSNAFQTVRQA